MFINLKTRTNRVKMLASELINIKCSLVWVKMLVKNDFQTRSINHKKIFGQNVSKVAKLTKNADIAFPHQNIAELPNMITMSKTGMSNCTIKWRQDLCQ